MFILNNGYDEGKIVGKAEGIAEGYATGLVEGVKRGYQDGYLAGLEAALAVLRDATSGFMEGLTNDERRAAGHAEKDRESQEKAGRHHRRV